ncbi:MAG: hypothetical protein HY606_09010 [Planctomycetes bacterium]|nr:hypothetical protein [Planctomycetota bacterium]
MVRKQLIILPAALLLVGLIYNGLFVSKNGREDEVSPDKLYHPDNLQKLIEKLQPLHNKLEKPRPGEWLHSHDEPGQTFKQYISGDPVTIDDKRKVIYIQPIGDFIESQDEIIKLTSEYMSLYFNLEVKIKDKLSLDLIPKKARRKHPQWGDDQILTTYVLNEVLKPKLPDDAMAFIAFTTSDLWPGEGWNFVFGQASLRDRVGVWSIYRNGDSSKGKKEFKLCLLRTLKTATHEVGHMFSMHHCIAYNCNMCGSNNREESDKRPLWLCPECVSKICWATRTDPVGRYEKLADFSAQQGLETEKKFFKRSVDSIK